MISFRWLSSSRLQTGHFTSLFHYSDLALHEINLFSHLGRNDEQGPDKVGVKVFDGIGVEVSNGIGVKVSRVGVGVVVKISSGVGVEKWKPWM